jgi:choline-sulfatase
MKIQNTVKLLFLGVAEFTTLVTSEAQTKMNPRPNIILIMCDQLNGQMLSCTGNPYVNTPNLDNLASKGCRFEKAYVTNAVCLPSRTSMLTGLMPSEAGVETNDDAEKAPPLSPSILNRSLGKIFEKNGYQCVYGGKIHLVGATQDTGGDLSKYGFKIISKEQRMGLAEKMADFLAEDHNKPFLMVASFINPHDICYMAVDEINRRNNIAYDPNTIERRTLAGAMKIPSGVSDKTFFEKICPPLPRNFEIPVNEIPNAVGLYHNFGVQKLRKIWTEEKWRMHRWAYKNLTELVDKEIGILLDALVKNGMEDNTLIMFVSDHGENDASHQLVHKSAFYEESLGVPLIVSWKGVIKEGLVDKKHIVSTGLDIIPSLCDFADISIPDESKGFSIKNIATGKSADKWRTYSVAEGWKARTVFDGRWKYMISGDSNKQEMLFDLKNDPGELKNLAKNPKHAKIMKLGLERLHSWYKSNGIKLDEVYY